MKELLKPGRHLPLLLALVALLSLYPLLLELGHARLMRVGFILVLLFGVYGLMERRGQAICGAVLAVPAMAAQAVALAHYSRATILTATLLGLLFLAYMLTIVLRSVLGGGRVTSDKIAGAISAYLLLGLVWALAFGALAILQPEAFSGLSMAQSEGYRPSAEYGVIYYSFVTLTTSGYGDIVPVSPIARGLAWMEAAAGQLFLAILIARLVGLHVLHTTSGES